MKVTRKANMYSIILLISIIIYIICSKTINLILLNYKSRIRRESRIVINTPNHNGNPNNIFKAMAVPITSCIKKFINKFKLLITCISDPIMANSAMIHKEIEYFFVNPFLQRLERSLPVNFNYM